MWENWVQSLGWKDPLERAMATHSSILAWRIPWIEESGRLWSLGSKRVRHDWATNTFSLSQAHLCSPWKSGLTDISTAQACWEAGAHSRQTQEHFHAQTFPIPVSPLQTAELGEKIHWYRQLEQTVSLFIAEPQHADWTWEAIKPWRKGRFPQLLPVLKV